MRERHRLDLLKLQSIEDKFEKKGKKKKGRNAVYAAQPGSFGEKLMQAGIPLPPRLYMLFAIAISLIAGLICGRIGILLGAFAFGGCMNYTLVIYIEERAALRRRKVIPQLAAFIDGMAAALGTGFNTEGAIIQAAQGVPAGVLKDELDRVVSALNRGFSVQDSIGILKSRITGKEVTSLAVSITLFAKMGGRLLEPFRRLAKKIREQQTVVEKASRDLVQVRQAFMILLILSTGTPGILFFASPGYLGQAFEDPFGRIILQFAVAIQLLMILIFKKITNLKV